MKHNDLPQHWKDKIYIYLSEKDSKYADNKRLSVDVFLNNLNLKITFDDESFAFFKDAFYLVAENLKEIAVFTEHCGYHLFNMPELLLETFDWNGNLIKTDNYRAE